MDIYDKFEEDERERKYTAKRVFFSRNCARTLCRDCQYYSGVTKIPCEHPDYPGIIYTQEVIAGIKK